MGGRQIAGSTNALVVVYSCPVSVVLNATLEADGLVKLTSLRVDPDTGGTLRGFAFDDDLVLDLTKKTSGSIVTLPLAIENPSGTPCLSGWRVTVNGEDTKWKAKFVDGLIAIQKPGAIVVVY